MKEFSFVLLFLFLFSGFKRKTIFFFLLIHLLMWQQPLQPSQYPSYAYSETPAPNEANIGKEKKKLPLKGEKKNLTNKG